MITKSDKQNYMKKKEKKSKNLKNNES